MHSIVELPTYIRTADKLLSQRENEDLISYLAERPTAGEILQGTGGIRK